MLSCLISALAVLSVPICGKALRSPISFVYAVCPPNESSSSWAVAAILYHWHSSARAGASDCANARPRVSSSHLALLYSSDSTPGGFSSRVT